MKNINLLIKKILVEADNIKESMVLTENVEITENLQYHLDNKIPLFNNVFRSHSESFFDLINEVRYLYENEMIELGGQDLELIESDLGKKVQLPNGKEIYLDIPVIEESLNEAEYQGRKVQVGRPMRNSGGGKKYVVYVKNPSTGKIKKISFGDVSGGLTAKVSNAKARKAFASRHQCEKKKDRMTAGYWACRINRYGHLWGGKTYPGFW
jgi:hypothetical protein